VKHGLFSHRPTRTDTDNGPSVGGGRRLEAGGRNSRRDEKDEGKCMMDEGRWIKKVKNIGKLRKLERFRNLVLRSP
jgi:hypothetical protein